MVTSKIAERPFEEAIECALLSGGPVACEGFAEMAAESSPAYGEGLPGGYRRRRPEDYDRALCLIPRDAADFVLATQPKTWQRLTEHHGKAEVRERFLARLSREIESRGALDVLRSGIKDSGCKLDLAYFRPSSGLNEELRRQYAGNLFAIVRQLRYSERNESSIDLAVFLNGIPIFTAELKNPLTGQNVEDAIRQYRHDRDPREPLISFRRCLAHFAVDPDLVYVTTRLEGPATVFLPFNQGWDRGAGNPPVAPALGGYATRYLWERVWARDSVLNLLQHFIHEYEEEDEKGKRTGRRTLIFPRYHQLDSVRRLVDDARVRGTGRRYLIQHSAGSGKSNSIAWLAHQLSVLHDAQDRRVFNSIVVVTDRRILDRQLQRTVRQFQQTPGVVENIDTTSRKLKEALELGKTIIVTTLQKFPVIAEEIGELPGERFAVIVDEAHSSQSGESTKSLKAVLSAGSLEEAEGEDAPDDEDLEDRIVAEMKKRGRLPNLSTFAFTATPKEKTLELFGEKRADGKFQPFSLYSMRQAIEEGFILDVLANYATYEVYWKLLKKIEDDPHYDREKATYLLRSFVDLHEHAIGKKIEIMVEHFAGQVADRIGKQAKAMIVTRSRLHAVRYRLALDHYLKERGHPWRALVAFSGTVKDGGFDYTEANMNGIPEAQTADAFKAADCRFLVVANKFQTGFDQPLLHTMYVDKKLGGVNAVQTLSRLNRVHPEKTETAVLDFANEADEISQAFEPYYEKTLLSDATDPNFLYELERKLSEFHLYGEAEVDAFAALYFKDASQDRLYAALRPIADRFAALGVDEQADFRSQLGDYVRLYAFLSQIVTFTDPGLEKLYEFARLLRRYLPQRREELPVEIQGKIDMDSYRVRKASSGRIRLDRQVGELEPIGDRRSGAPGERHVEPLSQIIAELNKRFGTDLTEEDRICIRQVLSRLEGDAALDASSSVNTRENLRLTFDKKLEDVIQQIVDANFKLYKRIVDDRHCGEALGSHLFDQYLRSHRRAEELAKLAESKTLELKATLRFDLKLGQNQPKVVTHAVLKTIAAFLNTEGGDLLIGVGNDGAAVGVETDGFESEDKFLLHLTHVVAAALGDRAGTCIDPRFQTVDGKRVCLVACQRSPEPIFLRWKAIEKSPEGDLYVRSGPGTTLLPPPSAREFLETRFPAGAYPEPPAAPSSG